MVDRQAHSSSGVYSGSSCVGWKFRLTGGGGTIRAHALWEIFVSRLAVVPVVGEVRGAWVVGFHPGREGVYGDFFFVPDLGP